MDENQLGSAATGSGGMSTDDTTKIVRAESSSFVAARDRLPVHLDISCSDCMCWRYLDCRNKF